jgi:hypothetical protein
MTLSEGPRDRLSFYRPQIAAKTRIADKIPETLGIALFAACLYAAFAEGAIRSPDEPRLQVGVAVIAALATAAWLWFGTLSLTAPRAALTALGLLIGFCAWSALTLAWSASPDGTWVEVNRVFTYTLVLAMALALGASSGRATAIAFRGVLGLTLTVCVYALAQKIVPGFRVAGLINLDQTAQFARLEAPLDYWNALALLVTLGAPAALTLALLPSARPRARLTGLIGLQLIVVTIGFTESRGGFLALAVALTAMVLLSPDRLTTLIWAAAAVAYGALDLILALLAHPLTGDGVALGRRELAGLYLLVILVAVAVLSALSIRYLDRAGPSLTRVRRRRIWRALGYGSVAVIGLGLIAAAASQRGLTGQISRLWDGFNNADSIAASSAGRLFSDSSANRVDWWGQALRAFVARPFGGYGAGSFPVINLLFRHDTVTVQDAHSVPLQWLAETGIVGFLLAVGAWLGLLRGGLQAVWRAGGDRVDPTRMDTEPARRRLAAAALLAAALAYSVHALYDWDWDIPGVTLPVLVILGVLAGSLARSAPDRPTVVIVPQRIVPRRELGTAARLVALAVIVAALCLFAISAVLPGLAATKANTALADADQGTPTSLAAARHEASFATSLDPLSGEGPSANADIAVREGEIALARDYELEAIRRQPTDWEAWDSLVDIDLGLHRDAEALAAARRVLELNPEYGVTGYLILAEDAITADIDQAPPQDSATAVATPGY